MKNCNTEIISVGTELLLGHITNTDARDVSEELAKIGINVLYHTVVGDNPGRLANCIEIAKQRADIIITTGGLGPTCDDLTKDMLAKSFGLQLIRNEAEYQGLYDYISARHKYTENNTKQAMLPEGCTVFHNTCGTAPGCAFEKDGKTVIMLPGPPKECMAMLRESVIPYLRTKSDEVILSHTVRIFGIGESGVDDIFADEMNQMTNPSLAPYAKEADCLLKVTAKAGSEAEAEALCRPVIDHICERLGEYVYGIDVESLEESAFALLKEKQVTLAFAESCTGGEVAKRLTDLPGASTVFKGGVVTYTNEAKATLLGIDPDVINTEGAVSYEVAAEMAENIRAILKADIGIGVTGLAGPDSDGVHEVGTVFVSLATENETFVKELHLGSMRSRSFVRRMAGNHIFDMIRRYLTGLSIL
jgi:nicotinamide-nucleotide amidase